MISTDKMIATIPPKDAWKNFRKDRRRKSYNVVPDFHKILANFDPKKLPERYLDEFRRRTNYTGDDYFLAHRDDEIFRGIPLSYYRSIDKAYAAWEKADALDRSYVKLLLITDDYIDGKIGDDEMSKAYTRTRKKLIEAIGAKAAEYIASIDKVGG